MFSGNTAYQYGGGVYNERSTATTLTNCTLSGNTALTDGGGIRNNNSPVMLTNCILLGNSPNEIQTVGNPNPRFSYNNIAGSGGSAAWDSSLV
jgi:parallel beta-helix repeat protein